MAATNDTIDGLLAEFRGYSAGMPASYHVTMSWADFRKMLDRFEVANKRERAMQKSVIDNLTKALKGTVEGLAWIYDREGYGYGTDAAYAAGCAVLDLLGVEYKKEGGANG